MSENSKPKKQLDVKQVKLPDTFVIMVCIMIFAALLTYLIPSGSYDMVKDAASGKDIVDTATFHYVAKTPTTLLQLLKAPLAGLKKQSSMILAVILICSCFHVVNDTKALSNFFAAAIHKFQNKAILLIPIIMALFGFLGTTGALVNSTVAFIPIGLVVASQLGMDRISAMAIIYLATFAGFGTSFMSVSSVQIAQEMADVPLLSGSGFRIVVSAIIILVSIIYTLRYSTKIMKDPTKSYLYGTAMQGFEGIDHPDFDVKLTWQDITIVILTFGGFGVFVYGAINLDWGQDMMAAFMLFIAIASGFLAKMTPDEIAASFKRGIKGIAPGMILVGFATGISLIMNDGNIIHTIIHAVAIPLSYLTGPIAAVVMFLFNLVFNFFVCSASGQAAIVMPIMTPLADVIGLTRQVAVLAYQYGDGLSNTIFPVSSSLVASLAIAGVPFEKWLKYQIPLFCIWVVIVAIAICVAVMTGLA